MEIKKRFFVVVHALSCENYGPEAWTHVKESAKVAFEEGVDGVFLIPDYEKGDAMATRYDIAKYANFLNSEYKEKEFKIGVNFLLRKNEYTDNLLKSFLSESNVQMLQMDYISAGISKVQYPETEIFGSFAFKYSKMETFKGEDLKVVTCLAESYCDVPTTSGPATGYAPPLEKVKEIRSYLKPTTRLALASGVSVDSVKAFMDVGATDFLVATSLIKEVRDKMDILDPLAVRRIAKTIKSYN